MADELYESDTLAWAERQAGLLRRFAAGEDVGAEIDWPNVIEEVGDVGLFELHNCEAQLSRAMVRILRLRLAPGSEWADLWAHEASKALRRAGRMFAPFMRERIRLARLYEDALHVLDAGPGVLPVECPFTLDELLRADLSGLGMVDAG